MGRGSVRRDELVEELQEIIGIISKGDRPNMIKEILTDRLYGKEDKEIWDEVASYSTERVRKMHKLAVRNVVQFCESETRNQQNLDNKFESTMRAIKTVFEPNNREYNPLRYSSHSKRLSISEPAKIIPLWDGKPISSPDILDDMYEEYLDYLNKIYEIKIVAQKYTSVKITCMRTTGTFEMNIDHVKNEYKEFKEFLRSKLEANNEIPEDQQTLVKESAE